MTSHINVQEVLQPRGNYVVVGFAVNVKNVWSSC